MMNLLSAEAQARFEGALLELAQALKASRNSLKIKFTTFMQTFNVVTATAINGTQLFTAPLGIQSGNTTVPYGYWPFNGQQFQQACAAILGFGFAANAGHPNAVTPIFNGCRLTFGQSGGGSEEISNVPIVNFPAGHGVYGTSEAGGATPAQQYYLSHNGIPAAPNRYNLPEAIVVGYNGTFSQRLDMDALTLAPTTTVPVTMYMYTLFANSVQT